MIKNSVILAGIAAAVALSTAASAQTSNMIRHPKSQHAGPPADC